MSSRFSLKVLHFKLLCFQKNKKKFIDLLPEMIHKKA